MELFLDVLSETLVDTAKMLPFLFLAYLFIEYVETRHGERIDVDVTRGEQPRHAQQRTGFVLQQDGQGVFHGSAPQTFHGCNQPFVLSVGPQGRSRRAVAGALRLRLLAQATLGANGVFRTLTWMGPRLPQLVPHCAKR